MLPESRLCSRESEQLRRLLKARTTLVRAQVVMKNQIHALLTAEGMEDVRGSLQSKRGRKRVLDTLKERENGLAAQPLCETIDRLEENVNGIEERLRDMTAGDRTVELLMTIPGCGEIGAWTIRAWTDDIKRFANAKKYVAYAGLAPWVQNSNEKVCHGLPREDNETRAEGARDGAGAGGDGDEADEGEDPGLAADATA
jgi:transposase